MPTFDINQITPLMNQLYFYGKVFFFVMIFTFGLWKLVPMLRYRMPVELYELRSNIKGGAKILKISNDRAKKIQKQGVLKFKLLKNKCEYHPTGNELTIYLKGKNDVLKLYKAPNGSLSAIPFKLDTEKNPNFEVMPSNVQDFLDYKDKEAYFQHKESNWLKENAGLVGLGVVAFVFLLGIYFLKGDISSEIDLHTELIRRNTQLVTNVLPVPAP